MGLCLSAALRRNADSLLLLLRVSRRRGVQHALRRALVDGNEGLKPPPAAAAKSLEKLPTDRSQKVSVQTSCQECSHVCWGMSGARTLHVELGGGGFRAVRHKLSTKVLRGNETYMYNLSVTGLSIPSLTPESDPLYNDHVSHTSGVVAATLTLTSLLVGRWPAALRGSPHAGKPLAWAGGRVPG